MIKIYNGSPINCSNYCLQIPVANKGFILNIEQSNVGLSLSIKYSNGVIKQIPKYLIEGLPKMQAVPKEFFDHCYVVLKQAGAHVKAYFLHRLDGGGGSASTERKESFMNRPIIFPGFPSPRPPLFYPQPSVVPSESRIKTITILVQQHINSIEAIYNQFNFSEIVLWKGELENYNREWKDSLNLSLADDLKIDFLLKDLSKRIFFLEKEKDIYFSNMKKINELVKSINKFAIKIKDLVREVKEIKSSGRFYIPNHEFNKFLLNLTTFKDITNKIYNFRDTIKFNILNFDEEIVHLKELSAELQTKKTPKMDTEICSG